MIKITVKPSVFVLVSMLVVLSSLPVFAADDAAGVVSPSKPLVEMPVPPSMPAPPAAHSGKVKKKGVFDKISSWFSKDSKDQPQKPSMPEMISGARRDRPVPPPPSAGGMFPGMMMQRREVPREADSKNLDIARKIVKEMTSDRPDMMLMRYPMARGMGMSVVSAISQKDQKDGEKARQIISELSEKLMQQHKDVAEKNRALAYAQVFTASELEQIEDFYGTDAGKKLLRSSGDLQAKETMLNRDSEMQYMEELHAAMVKELKKAGIKLPEGFEVKK